MAPRAFVHIDRDAAGRLGITPQQVTDALYSAFGQRPISTIFTQSNQYRVILDANGRGTDGLDAFDNVYIASAGGPVRLTAVATVTPAVGPASIIRQAQYPATVVYFEPAAGVSLGNAVDAVKQVVAKSAMPLDVELSFEGAADAFSSALSNQLLLVLAAVVVMYIVLGVLYESTIHPITILSTLPSAAVGALAALWLLGMGLGIIGIIGIVLLIGIVKKNAIMMIDFALVAEREDGLKPRDAIARAAHLRLRPILMTTAAALFGALPMAIGGGVGAELRRPMGVAIVGGLLVSQVLTLYTTPVIYLFFDRLANRLQRRFGGLLNNDPAGSSDPGAPGGDEGLKPGGPGGQSLPPPQGATA